MSAKEESRKARSGLFPAFLMAPPNQIRVHPCPSVVEMAANFRVVFGNSGFAEPGRPLQNNGSIMKASRRDHAQWGRMFKVLQIFFRSHRHVRVPPNPRPDSLGRWLAQQQVDYRAGKLGPARFKKLDALGVEFEEWEKPRRKLKQKVLKPKLIAYQNRRWELNFAKVVAFKRKFGDCVFERQKVSDKPFSTWVQRQRKLARSDRLPPRRRARLVKIGFTWKGGNPFWYNWDKHYAKLVAFKKKFGHCDVPCRWKEDHLFGHWVSTQRSFRKKGLLSTDRIARLEEIGFKWSVLPRLEHPPAAFRKWARAHDAAWAFHFARLRAYKKRHGSCNVHRQDGWNGQLYRWTLHQKEIAGAGRMPSNRRCRLEKLGMEWQGRNCLRELWEKRHAELVAFKNQFGHCDVVAKWKKNPALGRWVSNQRVFRKKGRLSADRIARLDKLGFRWVALFDKDHPPECFRAMVDASERLWNSNFARLEQFRQKHGHCAVTPKAGETLYKWVIRQRIKANAAQLPERRRCRLDKIGFVWKGLAYHVRWQSRYAELVAFKNQFGHCDVPDRRGENRGFGHWVYNQRLFGRQGRLSRERMDQLNRIGFRWQGPYQPQGVRSPA